jgi:hypothetical protein
MTKRISDLVQYYLDRALESNSGCKSSYYGYKIGDTVTTKEGKQFVILSFPPKSMIDDGDKTQYFIYG